jgi:hypothetical protein
VDALTLKIPLKSPLKRGTLSDSVPSFLRRVREDQQVLKRCLAGFKPIKKSQKRSPGQMPLWEEWKIPLGEIQEVAKKFVLANCLNPDIAVEQFTDTT